MTKFKSFEIKKIVPLIDRDYLGFVHNAIVTSVKRVWVNQFLIDMNPADDQQLEVRNLLDCLINAQRRNVDIRVLIDRIRGSGTMHGCTQLSSMYLNKFRVKCHYYSGKEHSSHSKYIVVDDNLIILGSHNFTENALLKHHESSIALYSRDMNIRLAKYFLREWTNALELYTATQTHIEAYLNRGSEHATKSN